MPATGTWAASAQEVEAALMPQEFQRLDDTTIRQIVRVSAGGDKLQVRFSNAFAGWRDTLVISEANLAVCSAGASIIPETLTPLTFCGEKSVSIPYGTLFVSDAVDFDLPAGSDLAVTIHVAKAPAKTTGHRSARGEYAFITSGNSARAQALPGAEASKCWYYLCGVDVLADYSAGSVVCLGDSITDGKGSTEGLNLRWPDYLARRLQANPQTEHIGLLNQGIGGNALWAGGIGCGALQRLNRDVFAQSGAKWVIVLEGINDLGGGNVSADELIAGYRQIIVQSRACGLKVYGSTILPCGESFYYSAHLEEQRKKVNDWIRNSGEFDAVIDWDMVVRDIEEPSRLKAACDSGDHLHLNDEGYRLMASAIDMRLFLR